MAVRTHQLVAVQEQVARHHVRQALLAVQNAPSRNRRLVAQDMCSSHATCEQRRPKQGEGKDQASDTYK